VQFGAIITEFPNSGKGTENRKHVAVFRCGNIFIRQRDGRRTADIMRQRSARETCGGDWRAGETNGGRRHSEDREKIGDNLRYRVRRCRN